MTQVLPVNVWLVEDNERLRRTLQLAIDDIDGLECGNAFGAVEAVFERFEQNEKPDVLLLDIGLPGIDGISALPRLKEMAPESKVVILTVFDDHDKVFRAMCAGADGYLLKTSSMERIADAVIEVQNGGASMNPEIARKVLELFANRPAAQHETLTERELEVLRLLVRGLTKKQIAAELDLSRHTVDSHIRKIYEKLQVNNRAGAVAAALRDGLV